MAALCITRAMKFFVAKEPVELSTRNMDCAFNP